MPDRCQHPLSARQRGHGLYARWRKIFERDGNTRTANFYRFWNEVPTTLLLIIVPMTVAKPF